MTPLELKLENCTSGHCASGQLSLTWILGLDREVDPHTKVVRPECWLASWPMLARRAAQVARSWT